MFCTLLSKQILNAKNGWARVGDGMEVQEGGDLYTHIADSLCCTVETYTTLYSNYNSIKKKKKLGKYSQTTNFLMKYNHQDNHFCFLRSLQRAFKVLVGRSMVSGNLYACRHS